MNIGKSDIICNVHFINYAEHQKNLNDNNEKQNPYYLKPFWGANISESGNGISCSLVKKILRSEGEKQDVLCPSAGHCPNWPLHNFTSFVECLLLLY